MTFNPLDPHFKKIGKVSSQYKITENKNWKLNAISTCLGPKTAW